MIATATAWCAKHSQLETIEAVASVRVDTVAGPHGGTTTACEVKATTTEGCRVHFVGGPDWSLVARPR